MKYLAIILAMSVAGCGYSARQNELVGQPKKLTHETPLICPDRVDLDISLGVMRNGVGSMSTQDLWLTVPKESDQKILTDAISKGKIVKVTYDIARIRWCENDHLVTSVSVEE